MVNYRRKPPMWSTKLISRDDDKSIYQIIRNYPISYDETLEDRIEGKMTVYHNKEEGKSK